MANHEKDYFITIYHYGQKLYLREPATGKAVKFTRKIPNSARFNGVEADQQLDLLIQNGYECEMRSI